MNKVNMFEVECTLNGALAVMQLAIDRMAGDIAECKTADKEDKGACANAIVAAAENIYCPALDSAFSSLRDLQDKICANDSHR